MPRKFLSKEPKSRLRRHIETLLFFLLLAASLLLLTTVLSYKDFTYPELHRSQPSPKKFVQSQNVPVKPEVIEHGLRDKKQVALTFDADMTPAMLFLLKKGIIKSWYNQKIKQVLDKENVKATIFLGGLWSKTYPEESYSLASDPLIEIGNHSYNHHAFKKGCFELGVIDDAADKNEVETAQFAIFKATGKWPKYFRFPGGCFEKIDVETITRIGLKIVHWDVVAGDGFNQNTYSIASNVLNNVQNGSIIVFHIHDGPYAPKTADALIKIIPELKKRGFQFVTISELLL